MVLQVQSLAAPVRKDRANYSHDRHLAAFERQIDHFVNVKRANTLLDISRIAAGKIELDFEDVDLSAPLCESIESYEAQLEKAGCAVLASIEPSIVDLWDRQALDRTFSNLLIERNEIWSRQADRDYRRNP